MYMLWHGCNVHLLGISWTAEEPRLNTLPPSQLHLTLTLTAWNKMTPFHTMESFYLRYTIRVDLSHLIKLVEVRGC